MPISSSQSNKLAAALEHYAWAGYTVFPLNGKIPLKGFSWPSAQFNLFPVLADFVHGNFGVKLGADDLVIDVDPRNFKDPDTFKRFEKTYQLPRNFVIITGSGGLHIYLKKPPEMAICGSLREWPGIEFKTKGQYVVGAASLHPDTKKPYLVASGCDWTALMAPAALLNTIGRIQALPLAGIKDYVSDGRTKARYIEYLEKAPIAIEGEGGDLTTFSVAAVGHDFGLHPDVVVDLMLLHYNAQCVPPWDAQDIKKKVYNAYKYSESPLGNAAATAVEFPTVPDLIVLDPKQNLFHRNEYGLLKKDMFNAALFLTNEFSPLKDLLGFNQFSNNIEFLRPAPWHHKWEKVVGWSDGEALRMKNWLSCYFKFEPSTPVMHEAAYVSSMEHQFHPVKTYLEGLKWDGHKRVHNWMHTILGAEDNDYTRAVSLKFLVAAIKRIYEPGCKFDYITVLEGVQGTFKSTTFEILASKPWFSDTMVDVSNKDAISTLFGKWIIELSEMVAHRKAESQAMKAFLSRNTDRCRPPYGRTTQDFQRQSVFVGTINPEEDDDLGWLNDTTGNRRYWPVKVGVTHIPDLEKLRLVRDQLWAEAYAFYKSGVPVYFEDKKIDSMATLEQNKRVGRDMWHDTIELFINASQNKDKVLITAGNIYSDGLGGNILHCTVREQRRIAAIMQKLGWSKGVYYMAEEKRGVRGYRRPELVVKKEV